MTKVIVQHHVADYDKWYPIYIEHGKVRRQHGGTGHTIFRGEGDANDLVVVNSFANPAGAQAFLADPSLQEAMAKATVDSEPKVWVVSEAEDQSY
jgi:hypothetical protein